MDNYDDTGLNAIPDVKLNYAQEAPPENVGSVISQVLKAAGLGAPDYTPPTVAPLPGADNGNGNEELVKLKSQRESLRAKLLQMMTAAPPEQKTNWGAKLVGLATMFFGNRNQKAFGAGYMKGANEADARATQAAAIKQERRKQGTAFQLQNTEQDIATITAQQEKIQEQIKKDTDAYNKETMDLFKQYTAFDSEKDVISMVGIGTELRKRGFRFAPTEEQLARDADILVHGPTVKLVESFKGMQEKFNAGLASVSEITSNKAIVDEVVSTLRRRGEVGFIKDFDWETMKARALDARFAYLYKTDLYPKLSKLAAQGMTNTFNKDVTVDDAKLWVKVARGQIEDYISSNEEYKQFPKMSVNKMTADFLGVLSDSMVGMAQSPTKNYLLKVKMYEETRDERKRMNDFRINFANKKFQQDEEQFYRTYDRLVNRYAEVDEKEGGGAGKVADQALTKTLSEVKGAEAELKTLSDAYDEAKKDGTDEEIAKARDKYIASLANVRKLYAARDFWSMQSARWASEGKVAQSVGAAAGAGPVQPGKSPRGKKTPLTPMDRESSTSRNYALPSGARDYDSYIAEFKRLNPTATQVTAEAYAASAGFKKGGK